MNKAERARFIAETLERLYPEVPIPLEHRDPYTLLVAVLLSAQCTDARVNKVTPDLFAMAQSPTAMAACSEDAIHEKIRSCGLARQKARNIRALSQILVARYGGQVPASFASLESLPGVGHKTASVVISQAFGVAAFPVDTHIHRLAKRWKLSSGRNVKQTEADLKRLFPKSSWGELHLRLIFYGRAYCPARGHVVARCPICFQLQNH